MAGRKPKKVGMTMMDDDGLIPVMVFKKCSSGIGHSCTVTKASVSLVS